MNQNLVLFFVEYRPFMQFTLTQDHPMILPAVVGGLSRYRASGPSVAALCVLGALLCTSHLTSLAANAPSVWGHPLYSLPIAQIYPTRSESESMAQERGVDEILRESGLSSEAILGWSQRNAGRRRRGDPS